MVFPFWLCYGWVRIKKRVIPKQMEIPRISQRDPSLDVLRTLAIVMVLVIHAGSGYLSQAPLSANWWGALVWGAVSRPAVPLFYMCSGALLLVQELTPKRILTHNLPRILCAMFVWAFLYQLWALPASGGFTATNLLQAVINTLTLRHENHFYYLHILLLVYAFLPVIRVFTRSASRRELEYALAVWLVTGIVFPLLQTFWPFRQIGPMARLWKLPMSYAAIGYALLGYYLRKYGGTIRRRWYAATLAAGFAVTFGGTAVLSLEKGALVERFLEGMSPGPMLMAFGWFGVILVCKVWPKTLTVAINRLAQASFCIYLSHILFLKKFIHLGYYAVFTHSTLSIPLMVILLLVCGWLLWGLLHRLPVVNRYLI